MAAGSCPRLTPEWLAPKGPTAVLAAVLPLFMFVFVVCCSLRGGRPLTLGDEPSVYYTVLQFSSQVCGSTALHIKFQAGQQRVPRAGSPSVVHHAPRLFIQCHHGRGSAPSSSSDPDSSPSSPSEPAMESTHARGYQPLAEEQYCYFPYFTCSMGIFTAVSGFPMMLQ
jgi:hypothetical protein